MKNNLPKITINQNKYQITVTPLSKAEPVPTLINKGLIMFDFRNSLESSQTCKCCCGKHMSHGYFPPLDMVPMQGPIVLTRLKHLQHL